MIKRSARRLWLSIASAAYRLRLALRRGRVIIYLSLQTILLLIGALVVSLGTLGAAVGASMIATGASGILIFGWVLYTEAADEKKQALNDFGFITAFPHRSIQIKSEYTRRIDLAHRHIDVMGFGLNALREDLAGQFREWSGRLAVRILLVDPEAPSPSTSYVNQRDAEERNDIGRIRDEVQRFVEGGCPVARRT